MNLLFYLFIFFNFVILAVSVTSFFNNFTRRIFKDILSKSLFKPGLRSFEKKIQEKFDGVTFKRMIGSFCGGYSSILVSILRRNIWDDWTQIAFLSTTKVTPNVVKDVLQLIRDPEISPALKERIFHWLCGVSIDKL